MGSISRCPKCNHWLNYDGENKEFYCSNDDCDYTEHEAWAFVLKRRFRREIDE